MKPRMFRWLLAVAVVGLSIAYLPRATMACCPCYQTPATQHINQSVWILTGRVVSIRRVSNNLIQGAEGRSEWKLRLRRHFSFKGQPPAEVDLLMLNDECALAAQRLLFRQLTVFAQPNPADLTFITATLLRFLCYAENSSRIFRFCRAYRTYEA